MKKNILIINIISYSKNMLNLYLFTLKNKKYKIIKISPQPLKRKTITVLRSPHKYKKAQQHFCFKLYKVSLKVTDIKNNDILDLILNKPSGLFLKFKILL